MRIDPKIFCNIPVGKPGKLGIWAMPIPGGTPAIFTLVVGLKVKVDVDEEEVVVVKLAASVVRGVDGGGGGGTAEEGVEAVDDGFGLGVAVTTTGSMVAADTTVMLDGPLSPGKYREKFRNIINP